MPATKAKPAAKPVSDWTVVKLRSSTNKQLTQIAGLRQAISGKRTSITTVIDDLIARAASQEITRLMNEIAKK